MARGGDEAAAAAAATARSSSTGENAEGRKERKRSDQMCEEERERGESISCVHNLVTILQVGCTDSD